MLTLDLPTTVITGEEFDIAVRRVASRRAQIIEIGIAERPRIANGSEDADAETDGPPAGDQAPAPPPGEHAGVTASVSDEQVKAWLAAGIEEQMPAMSNWRYVVGTFQIKIPVSRGDTLLRDEENTLAIMKWRLGQIATTNRWHPVLERYVGYLSARVDGLGGDSTSIEPSPDGVPVRDGKGREHRFTGRVCEVVFDCFGDFEGFVLRDCRKRRSFRSRERLSGTSCCGRVGSTSSSPCMSKRGRPGDLADRRDLLLITSTAARHVVRADVNSAPEARLLADRQHRVIVLLYQRSTVPPGFLEGLQRRRGGDPVAARTGAGHLSAG